MLVCSGACQPQEVTDNGVVDFSESFNLAIAAELKAFKTSQTERLRKAKALTGKVDAFKRRSIKTQKADPALVEGKIADCLTALSHVSYIAKNMCNDVVDFETVESMKVFLAQEPWGSTFGVPYLQKLMRSKVLIRHRPLDKNLAPEEARKYGSDS